MIISITCLQILTKDCQLTISQQKYLILLLMGHDDLCQRSRDSNQNQQAKMHFEDDYEESQASNKGSSLNKSGSLKSPPRRLGEAAEKQNHWIGNLNLSARQECKRVEVTITATKSQYQPKARASRERIAVQEKEVDRSICKQPMASFNDNNLMLKELNNKNIEITKLRESCSVLRTENQTLSLILKEKESEVDMLQRRMDELAAYQNKIESYELAISESKSLFKDIEDQMKTLDREGKGKDRAIDDYKARLQTGIAQIKIQEERISILERSVSQLTNTNLRVQEQNSELRRQCEQWKSSYVEASRHVQQLPELEIKLRSSVSTNKDLQDRITELLAANEKLKLQVGAQTMRDRKLHELESQIQSLSKECRQKTQELENLTEKLAYFEERSQSSSNFQEAVGQLQRQLQERTREFKILERKLEEKTIIVNNQQRELKRVVDDLAKFRERGEKIDHVSRENKRLASQLIDKIDLIEQLQMQLNAAESKAAGLANESIKLSALYEQATQTIRDSNATNETLRNQLQIEASLKTQMSDKCQALSVEISVLTSTLAKEKETGRAASSQKEALKVQTQQLTTRLQESQSRLEILRSETQAQASHDRSKIEQLSTELRESKKRLEVYSKKDKQQLETIRLTEYRAKQLESTLATTQRDLEESLQQIRKLTKWKHQYLRFMETFAELGQKMTDYGESLL